MEKIEKFKKEEGRYLEYPRKRMQSQHFVHDTLKGCESIKNVQYFAPDNKKQLLALYELGTNICGHPNIVHGGLTTAILDNSSGAFAFGFIKAPATKFLNVQFKKPIKVGETLVTSSRITSEGIDEKERSTCEVETEMFDSTGSVCAFSVAAFVDVANKWELDMKQYRVPEIVDNQVVLKDQV